MQVEWERCLNYLRGMLSDSVYKTYFAQTKLVNQTTGHATISIPFGLDAKVYSAYKDLIRLGWRETTHDDSPIEFDFLSQEAIPQSAVNAGENVFKDFAKPSVPLSSSFRFENFVPGDKAQLAFNAALAVARNPDGTQYNPLFIYGSSGLGKTHLLQAIGNYILEDDPNKRVCYLTSEDFSQQYMKCLKENRVTEMSDFYRNEVDILLIDDIQNWTGKYETQNEFFLIFNALHQAGKQIVLTSDAPAVEVKNLSDRLVSRFAWGLTVDIQPPDVETREAILQKKAEERHLEISDEVIHFLAEHIASNVRCLESAIIKLTLQASLMNHDIDMSIAQKVVAEIAPTLRRRVSLDAVLHAVSQHYEVPESKLTEPGRGTKEISKARQVAMFLMRECSSISLQSIGSRFGGKDHSTVVHAIKSVKKEMETDPSFARLIESLKNSIHD
ncbi:MAG: chromosomal replication initiator protein DnaA [Fibrobacter sp.]|nr:chromosomal replication initiator protein DnaA [Fibrobacter sp.]MBO7550290.1 chromosomal replication initiator protein DnaA [Fibrobacter sp.]MBQ3714102.1 chromosomal replication initiator protein DnaA [Fibrobacter sp.]